MLETPTGGGMKMTFDQFYAKLIYDTGRFKATKEAALSMEYDEWLERFSVFATRKWMLDGYKDGGE
jgi:hypothetical protein